MSRQLTIVGTFPQLEYPRGGWEPWQRVVGPLMWEQPYGEVEPPPGELRDVREVEAHVAKEVGGREGKPREHLHEIEALEQLHARPPQSRSPIPVTTMFRIDSGKSPSQPRRIAWS